MDKQDSSRMGSKRGGNFSCLCGVPSKEHQNLESAYGFHPPSLEDRFKVFKGVYLWRKFSITSPSPFSKLKKEDLLMEYIQHSTEWNVSIFVVISGPDYSSVRYYHAKGFV